MREYGILLKEENGWLVHPCNAILKVCWVVFTIIHKNL